MKKVLLFCMCLSIVAGAAFADASKTWYSKPTKAQETSVQNSTDIAALRAELEATEAELAAAKLNGDDEAGLIAIIRDLRGKLGYKPVEIGAPAGSSLDEGGESCTSATPILSLPYADGGNTCDNAPDYTPSCVFSTSADVFYSFSPAADVTATLTTCHTATDFDTEIFVLNSAGVEVVCNDDAPGAPLECDLNGNNRKSLIECFTFLAGETYCIGVTGFSGFCGNYLFTIEECSPCDNICPPNAWFEDEQVCGPDFVDLNGTCNDAFDLPCGTTVCGTAGRYTNDLGQTINDRDYYRVTLTEPGRLVVCANVASVDQNVSFSIHPFIPNHSTGCDIAFFYLDNVSGCVQTCGTTDCLNPGDYFVQALSYADCGIQYSLSVECLPCPCDIVCPPDAIIEDEGPCGPDFVDTYNGGCFLETPSFPHYVDVSCDATICGTSGTFVEDIDGISVSDEDWYRVVLTEPASLEICMEAGGAGIIGVFQGPCPVGEPFQLIGIPFCESGCWETICLEPGEYFVATILFGECGSPYRLSIDCLPCEPCDVAEIQSYIGGPLPWCQCLYAECEGLMQFCVGPLGPTETPFSGVLTFGCDGVPPRDNENQEIPLEPCEDECPPAEFLFDPVWTYDEDRGFWCAPILISEPGCMCFCLDEVLPVELNEFTAIAGDREVKLNWSTASETDNDHFDIERDGIIVGRVNATNSPSGSTYEFLDNTVDNGTQYNYSLISVSVNGTREQVSRVSATPTVSAANVTEYSLHQNYPNPFNPETNIIFDIVEAGNVTLTVYNPLGQTIATLVNGSVEAGRHTVNFDAGSQPSGLYFYRLEANDFTAVRKMILMK